MLLIQKRLFAIYNKNHDQALSPLAGGGKPIARVSELLYKLFAEFS